MNPAIEVVASSLASHSSTTYQCCTDDVIDYCLQFCC